MQKGDKFYNNEVNESFVIVAEAFMQELRQLPHKEIIIGIGGASGWTFKWKITRMPNKKGLNKRQIKN